MNQFDVIIIGGGAAGQMAAISAKRHNPHYSVAIIDRTFALGRKILVCGAGRCNVTNINLDKSVEDHYYGASPEFIQGVFSQFGFRKIVTFFDDLGVELYVERKTDIGKLFPTTDQAKTITALLEDELNRLDIKIFLNTEVQSVVKTNKFELVCKKVNETGNAHGDNLKFEASNLVLSAGGKTYPALGSNGSGYNLAASFGHKIITPVPSALPLVSKNPLSHALQGVKMEIEVTSIINDKAIKTRTDDVMFTQYGLSGPAILNISREISIHLNREGKNNVWVRLNFFPGKTKQEVDDFLTERWRKRPDQSIEKSLFGIFPNKIPPILLQIFGIAKDTKVRDLNQKEIHALVNGLTDYKVMISGTRSWNEAEFTAGGIDTKEVSELSLMSKKVKGLYFCGEILDVDGDVGGFNLSWAWSSGYVAGKIA